AQRLNETRCTSDACIAVEIRARRFSGFFYTPIPGNGMPSLRKLSVNSAIDAILSENTANCFFPLIAQGLLPLHVPGFISFFGMDTAADSACRRQSRGTRNLCLARQIP